MVFEIVDNSFQMLYNIFLKLWQIKKNTIFYSVDFVSIWTAFQASYKKAWNTIWNEIQHLQSFKELTGIQTYNLLHNWHYQTRKDIYRIESRNYRLIIVTDFTNWSTFFLKTFDETFHGCNAFKLGKIHISNHGRKFDVIKKFAVLQKCDINSAENSLS